MQVKDSSVECNLHPTLTDFLFFLDRQYPDSVVITSGSEHSTRHSRTSLHYAIPACAVDLRSWVLTASEVREAADAYLAKLNMPANWIDVIEESDHTHVEFQPKRRDK